MDTSKIIKILIIIIDEQSIRDHLPQHSVVKCQDHNRHFFDDLV